MGSNPATPTTKKRVIKLQIFSGCSAVRLAHLLWEQGVVGSNPATPTKNSSQEKLNGVELIQFVSAFFVYVN